ncbi:unnamed protein product [Lactuca saligna]|uniref:Uncharacterized protein n=1 Tax=Lactuca saligna TaxID=75948 RepID=A0AA35Z486_LACSI|nr:unnamed protein product [Lactuca saligna]
MSNVELCDGSCVLTIYKPSQYDFLSLLSLLFPIKIQIPTSQFPISLFISPKLRHTMDDFKSKSYNYSDRDMQLERYNGGFGSKMPDFEHHPPRDFRSYSVSYASSYKIPQTNLDIVVSGAGNDFKLKKGKSTNGSATKSWSFSDPEFQRKKRVAGYKVYSVEGKLKGSFRKSFRWLKDKYTHVVYG